MRDPKRVAVLISGRGSNMRALIEKASGYEVALVASNKPQAAGLDWARDRGVPTWTWDSKGVDKETFDRTMSAALANTGQPGTSIVDGCPGASYLACFDDQVSSGPNRAR